MTRLTVVLMILGLAGCSWAPEHALPPADSATRSVPTAIPRPQAAGRVQPASGDIGWIAASIAQQQVGVPYVYGGRTPRGFDCSGLVQFAYAEAGRDVPRTTGELWRAARSVPASEARPGDLVFFDISGKPGHVGMYLGDGYFVHAPSTGRQVNTQRIDDAWYSRRILRFGRIVD